ncbi:MAG: ABC transporter ATP-binding protein [Treponemataceae bacterium]|nr:MAG: ABC transporter ATP-binding protein [Treponemataceae bacterium]
MRQTLSPVTFSMRQHAVLRNRCVLRYNFCSMLKLEHISKTFNPGAVTEKRALTEINFHLKPQDFVTVIGGNGAGKSTLLNVIAGVFQPDSGSVLIQGSDVTKYKEHERAKFLGRVFQDPLMGSAADMEIEENLALADRRGKRRGLKWGITAKERALFAEKLSKLDLGLETRLHSKVGLLSGGQRQALTLLMATIQKPLVLLLDEHTAALDPKTAAKVLELTETFVREGALSAFMVTHNMRNALQYGNRLIMMNSGSIVFDVEGEAKKKLTVDDLLKKFHSASGSELTNDRMLLDN